MPMKIGVITNPNSRKNRGRPDRVEALQGILGELGEVHQTPDVNSIKPVLRDFLRQRAQFWVSDGGDGALHWMLRQGMEVLAEEEFAETGATLPLAVPTNGGSIDFVAHNAGIRGNAESILATLRHAVEKGQRLEEVEVDSMLVEGVEVTAEGDQPFRTLGFAVAAGGVGQRFFAKLFEEGEHTGRTIVSIVAKTVGTYPVAMSPLRHLPGVPQLFRQYARDVFRPTKARMIVDGVEFPGTDLTAVHIASMSINLGGVFRLFTQADEPGQLNVLGGAPSPLTIISNIPRMYLGLRVAGEGLIDERCREMTLVAAGDELLAPIIDGELYANVRQVTFKVGPRVRIPKVVGTTATLPRNN